MSIFAAVFTHLAAPHSAEICIL